MIFGQIKNFATAHRGQIVVAIFFFVCLLVLASAFGGFNKVSNWWYSKGTEGAHEEINKARGEAAAAKAVAEEALKELALEKERYEVEKTKRQLAEMVLADKSLTANEKLRKYEEARASVPTVSAPAGSVDELCERAAAANIRCDQ